MDWTNALEHIVQRYSGQAGGAAAAPEDPHQDFQQVTQAAPPNEVAHGISQAFRSEQTPPFATMVSNLFGHSDPEQQAGLLNRLLQAVGPGSLASVPGLGGLSSLFGGGTVTPQQASKVMPEHVEQLAAHAERENPSIVDEVSNFCAQHPDVMKAAGGLALTIALQHILKRR